MLRLRYEVDPYNRLVISESASGVPRQRRVVDGVFRTGSGNVLTYDIKSPLEDGLSVPRQVRFSGTWSLTKDHDLRFTVDSDKLSAERSALTLSGKILSVRGDALIFAVRTRHGDDITKTYLVELSGRWRREGDGRIIFSVERSNGRYDTLTFGARWEIGRDDEIEYVYEKRARVGALARVEHRFAFKGSWSYGGPGSVAYSLEGSSNSTFRFSAGIAECLSDRIRFELGCGAARRLRPALRTLIVYGSWKVEDRGRLRFEAEFSDGKVYSVAFDAAARVTGIDTVEFRLKGYPGRDDLDLRLELKREMVKGDGSLFMRILKSPEESAVMAGCGISW